MIAKIEIKHLPSLLRQACTKPHSLAGLDYQLASPLVPQLVLSTNCSKSSVVSFAERIGVMTRTLSQKHSCGRRVWQNMASDWFECSTCDEGHSCARIGYNSDIIWWASSTYIHLKNVCTYIALGLSEEQRSALGLNSSTQQVCDDLRYTLPPTSSVWTAAVQANGSLAEDHGSIKRFWHTFCCLSLSSPRPE